MALGRFGKGTALALGVAMLAGVHCSGKRFSPSDEPALGGSSAGGTSPGGGGSSPGGSGGSTSGGSTSAGSTSGGSTSAGNTSAGNAGQGGSDGGGQGDGGMGGAVTCDEATPCPAGRYCDQGGECAPCNDITTLDDPGAAAFGPPEPLSALNDTAGDFFLRTPRAFGANGLVYVRDFFGGEIWLTGDADTDVGAPLPSPINDADYFEGSPLWLGALGNAFDSANFVFNRAADASSPYELYVAELAANGNASNLAPLPAPFNPTPPLSQSVYAMALSQDRAWWVVNRDLMYSVQLLTAPLDGSGPPSVVPLELSSGCRLVEFDYSPWVTPDGTLLFVNATERGDDCSQLGSSPMDIVVMKLDGAGQPRGPAVPLASVNHPGVTELDASLSPDFCSLYFVTSAADKLRLMRARRSGLP